MSSAHPSKWREMKLSAYRATKQENTRILKQTAENPWRTCPVFKLSCTTAHLTQQQTSAVGLLIGDWGGLKHTHTLYAELRQGTLRENILNLQRYATLRKHCNLDNASETMLSAPFLCLIWRLYSGSSGNNQRIWHGRITEGVVDLQAGSLLLAVLASLLPDVLGVLQCLLGDWVSPSWSCVCHYASQYVAQDTFLLVMYVNLQQHWLFWVLLEHVYMPRVQTPLCFLYFLPTGWKYCSTYNILLFCCGP